jgi:U1 small nuclear ribonucleoprotein 70kDa
MTDKLPPDLLQLFQPRPPVKYYAPLDNAPEEKASKPSTITGLAAFLGEVENYAEEYEYQPSESWLQKRDRVRAEKKQRIEDMSKEDFDGFKPAQDPKVKGDALKTLFVSRLSYDVKEQDLEREFGRFGPIERIRIVKDESTSKPKKSHRGYAFIVYERERDMKGNESHLREFNGKIFPN